MEAGTHVSANRTARLAGALHLALLPFGIFSFAYVPSVLVVPGDAAATSSNIMASELLFRASTISHLISQVVVIFLAFAMYRLLRPVSRERAVLMVVLALLSVGIAFLNEVNNLAVLWLLGSVDDGAYTLAQLQSQAMLFLDMGRNGVLIAQLFWSGWLLTMSTLVFRSGFLPKLLAVSTSVAAAGYLFDSVAQLLFPGFSTISQYTFFAELLLPLWLLIKGVSADDGRQAVAA